MRIYQDLNLPRRRGGRDQQSGPQQEYAESLPRRPGRDGWSNLLASESFGLLAEADFDAAVALAQSIVRPETSIAAQLALCRWVLSRKQ